MANSLPQYYVQCMKSMPARNVYNQSVQKKGSKRFFWTKEYTKLYKKEKSNRSLNKNRNLKSNSKQKTPTSIENIDKLYHYEKYTIPQEKVKTSIATTVKVEKENIPTTINSGVYNQREFDSWCKRTRKKQERNCKTSAVIKHTTHNYYRVLTYNQQEKVVASKENSSKSKNNSTSKAQVKQHKMPRLERKYEEPTTQMMDIDTVSTNKDTNEKEKKPDDTNWQEVNDKDTTQKKKASFEKTSQQYLPTNLPEDKQIDNKLEQKTKFVLPLSIKVNKKWKSKATIHKSRVMVAILQAMQNVYPDTYLATTEDDKTIPAIINIKDVPMDENQIRQYLATPMNPTKTFHAKVYMMTNHTIQEYKGDTAFFEYIKKENIVIEINDLDDINPVHVGFLEEVIRRYNTL
jgi:hypothetical protein